jgi:hypothetical protein
MGLYNCCGLVMVSISKMAARKGLHLNLQFVGNELGSTVVDVDVYLYNSSAEENRVNVSGI